MRPETSNRILIGFAVICAAVICSAANLLVAADTYPFSPEDIERAGELAAAKVAKAAQEQSPNIKATEQADIYAGGAAGVDQRGGIPDCWFEAAVASLARLPNGRVILSQTITKADSGYTVRFRDQPSQTLEITPQMLAQDRLHDSALWARILDEAAITRFPHLAEGKELQLQPNVPNAAQGLSILTGHQAQFVWTAKTSEQKIANILQRCLQTGVPMIAGSSTKPMGESQVVIPGHSYTVIGFDPQSLIVELRNPFGNNGLPNQLRLWPNLPQTGEERAGVQAEGGGLIRIDLSHFRKYYRCLCWTPVNLP